MKKFLVVLVVLASVSPIFALEQQLTSSFAPTGNLENFFSYKLVGLLGKGNSLELGYSFGPLPTKGYIFSLTVPSASKTCPMLGGSNHRVKYDSLAVKNAQKAANEMLRTGQGNYPSSPISYPIVKVQRSSMKFIINQVAPHRIEQTMILSWQEWNRYLPRLVEMLQISGGVMMTSGTYIFTGDAKFTGFFVDVRGFSQFQYLRNANNLEWGASFYLKDKKISWSLGSLVCIDLGIKYFAVDIGLNMRVLGNFNPYEAEIWGIDFAAVDFIKNNLRAKIIFGLETYPTEGEIGRIAPHVGFRLTLDPDLH